MFNIHFILSLPPLTMSYSPQRLIVIILALIGTCSARAVTPWHIARLSDGHCTEAQQYTNGVYTDHWEFVGSPNYHTHSITPYMSGEHYPGIVCLDLVENIYQGHEDYNFMETTPFHKHGFSHQTYVAAGRWKTPNNTLTAWITEIANEWNDDDPRQHCHNVTTTTSADLEEFPVFAIAEHPPPNLRDVYHIFALKYTTSWSGAGMNIGDTYCGVAPDVVFPPPFPMVNHIHSFDLGKTRLQTMTVIGPTPPEYTLNPIYDAYIGDKKFYEHFEF
jgi:hypothetical protein